MEAHALNPWSDTAWYFLRVMMTPIRSGCRQCAGHWLGTLIRSLSETDFHLFHELEQSTIIRSGRNFFGEVFDQNPTHTIPFQVPDVVAKTAGSRSSSWAVPSGAVSPYAVTLG